MVFAVKILWWETGFLRPLSWPHTSCEVLSWFRLWKFMQLSHMWRSFNLQSRTWTTPSVIRAGCATPTLLAGWWWRNPSPKKMHLNIWKKNSAPWCKTCFHPFRSIPRHASCVLHGFHGFQFPKDFATRDSVAWGSWASTKKECVKKL